MKKNSLRKKYQELRNSLSEEEVEELSLQISNNLLQLDIWDKTYYHIFLPILKKREVNTEFILHILQGKDKSVIVSKADFLNNKMQNFLLQENTVIRISEYGIPEPVDGIEIPENKIEVVFVPLLAFDEKGNRIGYGKGFYDRFLSNCRHETIKIGISFFESERNIEPEKQDVRLDFCITPKKIYTF